MGKSNKNIETRPELFAPLAYLKKPSKDDFYEHCQVGHETHHVMAVHRILRGQPSNLSAPAIRDDLGLELDLMIYDWREYFITVDGNETVSEHGKYCPGQDIISYCIDKQGVWEGPETIVILDILNENRQDDLVLDFGSHIGYYSLLAAKKGYRVASLDGNTENLNLLRASALINGLEKNISSYHCWLDNDSPLLAADQESVHLMKVDIEGAEIDAYAMTSLLFQEKKIKYAIFEISPTFNNTYPALVESIVDSGYDVFQIPGNNWEHNDEFSRAPLDTIKKYCQVPRRGRIKYVKGLHQENFLFIRHEDV